MSFLPIEVALFSNIVKGLLKVGFPRFALSEDNLHRSVPKIFALLVAVAVRGRIFRYGKFIDEKEVIL